MYAAKRLFFVGLVFIVSTSQLFTQEIPADELGWEQEMDNFYSYRRKNLKEATHIIEKLYNKYPNNERVIIAKIEFEFKDLGHFEDAIALIHQHEDILTSPESKDLIDLLVNSELKEGFQPLILRVKDKKIVESAYIPNIKIDIIFPSSEFLNELSHIQKARFRYIRSPEFSVAKRFHFVPDETGSDARIIKVDYFPVSSKNEVYKLVVDRKRRYPFTFSEHQTDTVSIFWHDEWNLREWIPDDYLLLTYPDNYSIKYANESVNGLHAGTGFEKVELKIAEGEMQVKLEPKGIRKIILKTIKITTMTIMAGSIIVAIVLSTGG